MELLNEVKDEMEKGRMIFLKRSGQVNDLDC